MMRLLHLVLAVSIAGCVTVVEGPPVDDSQGGPVAAPNGTNDVDPSRMRVFMTAATYTGNLREQGGAASGPEAADKLCAAAAASTNLGGQWTAWISDEASHAIDRIVDEGPWHTTDRRELVFQNRAALASKPLAAVSQDERGRPLSEYGSAAWTGTGAGGRRAAETCNDWSSETAYGTTTRPSFERTSDFCGSDRHLICFERRPAG